MVLLTSLGRVSKLVSALRKVTAEKNKLTSWNIVQFCQISEVCGGCVNS